MALIFSSPASLTFTVPPNAADFVAGVVTVVTAGTEVQLPTVTILDGDALCVRASVANKKKLIYLSNSALNVADPTKRVTLAAGEGITLKIADADAVWVDADTDGASVEYIVEQ